MRVKLAYKCWGQQLEKGETLLFTNCREEVFSETELPEVVILEMVL